MKKINSLVFFIALLVLNACRDDINFSSIDTLNKLTIECAPHQQSNFIEGEINGELLCLGQSAPILDIPIVFTDTSFNTYNFKAILPIIQNGKTMELVLNNWIHKDSLLLQNACVFRVNDSFEIVHPNIANEKANFATVAGITLSWDKNDKHEAFIMQTKRDFIGNYLKIKNLIYVENNGVINGTMTLQGQFALHGFNGPPCFFCGNEENLPNNLNEIANVKKATIKFNFIQK